MEPSGDPTTGGLWTRTTGRFDAQCTFVLLHGFTQTHRSWDVIADQLVASSRRVITVDLPGHGRSSDVAAGNLWDVASLVEATLPPSPVTVVGYSMGGRIALHLALALAARSRRDAQIDRLVLIGATAGLDDADARARRREADELLAQRVLTIGVEEFLTEWLAGPLFARLDATQSGVEHRRSNTAAGLAASLRTAGTGTQQPLWDRLGDIGCPVDVLVGEHDPKFTEIAQRLVATLPQGRLHVITDAGHACHLERPHAVLDVLNG